MRPRRTRRTSLRLVVGLAVAAIAVTPLAVPAQADRPARVTPARVTPARVTTAPVTATATADDFCHGQCSDIMPPGQSGQATFADLLAFMTLGTRPKHSSDTIGAYEQLIWDYPDLTDDGLGQYFNDASFGVPAGDVERVTQPRHDVTITRDKQTGVPHVQGTTRAGTMFGAGYAGAQDRLFLMDVLRHVGRGQLTPFAGGAPGNQEFEQQQWAIAPYTEADLQAQIDQVKDAGGPRGRQAYDDVLAYVDGVNAYIRHARLTLSLPGEYTALGKPAGPEPWRPTDLVATASLVGGIFGGGGGREIESALALVEARVRHGAAGGTQVWQSFRGENDPEAPTTLHDGQTFPYSQTPADPLGRAIPDHGTVRAEPQVFDAQGLVPDNDAERGLLGDGVLPDGFLDGTGRGMSNALVVSGAHTASGHPVAVFGPQTGYFAPQLLMRQELQGPGISARGAAFAGVNLYVQLGRGQDFAWSATSAGQDVTDTFAVLLCEPGGGTPTLDSRHYEFRGVCKPFEALERTNAWTPSLADSTPAGSYTLRTLRTELGLVSHRGTVGGEPVAFTRLRSTYRHEVDSVTGFQALNDPAGVTSADTFKDAAYDIGYAFNWFYADADDTAYFNSGDNPVRAAHVDPNLPVWGEPAYEWQGWDPQTNTADHTPQAEHPHATNQEYFTSWNNKQAQGYSAADGNFSFGPVHRSQPLDDRIKPVLDAGGTFTRSTLTQAMADAATVDLRGEQVLPLLLRVLDSGAITDPAVRDAVATLREWEKSGAQRRISADPKETGDFSYDHSAAVQIMDAWWPVLVEAEFRPGLGRPLYDALRRTLPLDNPASHLGSAYQSGWYGYVHKDLRQVLGDPVAQPFPHPYCGDGDLGACRQVLQDSLSQALAVPATEVYPGDADCAAGDQYCHDQVIHQPVGGITQDKLHWMNRPTYQQAVEFPARRPQ